MFDSFVIVAVESGNIGDFEVKFIGQPVYMSVGAREQPAPACEV